MMEKLTGHGVCKVPKCPNQVNDNEKLVQMPYVAALNWHKVPSSLAVRQLWAKLIHGITSDSQVPPDTHFCSNHFADGKPTAENPYPTLYLDGDETPRKARHVKTVIDVWKSNHPKEHEQFIREYFPPNQISDDDGSRPEEEIEIAEGSSAKNMNGGVATPGSKMLTRRTRSTESSDSQDSTSNNDAFNSVKTDSVSNDVSHNMPSISTENLKVSSEEAKSKNHNSMEKVASNKRAGQSLHNSARPIKKFKLSDSSTHRSAKMSNGTNKVNGESSGSTTGSDVDSSPPKLEVQDHEPISGRAKKQGMPKLMKMTRKLYDDLKEFQQLLDVKDDRVDKKKKPKSSQKQVHLQVVEIENGDELKAKMTKESDYNPRVMLTKLPLPKDFDIELNNYSIEASSFSSSQVNAPRDTPNEIAKETVPSPCFEEVDEEISIKVTATDKSTSVVKESADETIPIDAKETVDERATNDVKEIVDESMPSGSKETEEPLVDVESIDEKDTNQDLKENPKCPDCESHVGHIVNITNQLNLLKSQIRQIVVSNKTFAVTNQKLSQDLRIAQEANKKLASQNAMLRSTVNFMRANPNGQLVKTPDGRFFRLTPKVGQPVVKPIVQQQQQPAQPTFNLVASPNKPGQVVLQRAPSNSNVVQANQAGGAPVLVSNPNPAPVAIVQQANVIQPTVNVVPQSPVLVQNGPTVQQGVSILPQLLVTNNMEPSVNGMQQVTVGLPQPTNAVPAQNATPLSTPPQSNQSNVMITNQSAQPTQTVQVIANQSNQGSVTFANQTNVVVSNQLVPQTQANQSGNVVLANQPVQPNQTIVITSQPAQPSEPNKPVVVNTNQPTQPMVIATSQSNMTNQLTSQKPTNGGNNTVFVQNGNLTGTGIQQLQSNLAWLQTYPPPSLAAKNPPPLAPVSGTNQRAQQLMPPPLSTPKSHPPAPKSKKIQNQVGQAYDENKCRTCQFMARELSRLTQKFRTIKMEYDIVDMVNERLVKMFEPASPAFCAYIGVEQIIC